MDPGPWLQAIRPTSIWSYGVNASLQHISPERGPIRGVWRRRCVPGEDGAHPRGGLEGLKLFAQFDPLGEEMNARLRARLVADMHGGKPFILPRVAAITGDIEQP